MTLNPRISGLSGFNVQRGISLIEVLVAVLVLSVGLLGLAALQGFSLQSGQSAYQQTQATNIAYELSDHMRANRSVIRAGGAVPALDQWNFLAAELLPNGELDVDIVDAANGIVAITVNWSDDRLDDAPDDGDSISIQTQI
ncbi:MAG: type IV pilus modification protein PilV [Gammaproteobacteria bacterium]|jgi:type IV pilus assembly protein PilV|nr:type IV pilus modification protein PilV [Gammaproteobacteria bacterium]